MKMNPSNKMPPAVKDLAAECGVEITPELELFVAKLGHRWLGINTPFICGGSEEKDSMGLPKTLFICPAYGLDGFAIYKMTSEYSAPGW
jgi:hypothetical protein